MSFSLSNFLTLEFSHFRIFSLSNFLSPLYSLAIFQILFSICRDDPACRTPRRNAEVASAIDFSSRSERERERGREGEEEWEKGREEEKKRGGERELMVCFFVNRLIGYCQNIHSFLTTTLIQSDLEVFSLTFSVAHFFFCCWMFVWVLKLHQRNAFQLLSQKLFSDLVC